MNANSSYISERITVPPEFGEVFSHFYLAENHGRQEVEKTLLPSFQTILVLSFGVSVSFISGQASVGIDQCMVLGPVKQPIRYSLPEGAKILVINFIADAFYRFFGQAMITQNQAVHPDTLLKENCFTHLWSTLKELPSTENRISYILDFCRPYLKERDPGFSPIAGYGNEHHGMNPVRVIASQTNQSERSVQLKHKKYLGYSAKEIARYRRFLKALDFLQELAGSGGPIDWFGIVDRCGYYDQSQMIHDFRHFIHLSPRRYLQFQQDICIARPE